MLFWWQALVAAAAATAVMTALMRVGASMGMTRMDMSLMLGSMFRRDADAARRMGLPIHFVNGLVFGLVYGPRVREAAAGAGESAAREVALPRSVSAAPASAR